MRYITGLIYNNPTINAKNQMRRFILFPLVLFTFLILACSPKSLQVKSEAVTTDEKVTNLIQKLEISEEEGKTKLIIQGSRPMAYTIFKPIDNPRIVVDIQNADLGKLAGTIDVNNGTINHIKGIQFDNKAGKVSRIEIGLDRIVDYKVAKDTDKLIIYVKKSVGSKASSVKSQNSSMVKEFAAIESIDFRQMKKKTQLIVTTSSKARYDLSRMSEDTLVLELAEMEIPDRLQKELDNTKIKGAVKLIKPYQTAISGVKAVNIDIKLKTMVPYHIFQEKNMIYIDFDQPQEVSSRVMTPASSYTHSLPKPKFEATARINRAGFSTGMSAGKGRLRKRYTGKKISMDFKDADIKNLFRLIAEVSNLNIIAGDDVKGNITIRLVNVPWDQALDVILATNKLGKVRVGNIVRIAPAETLRKEEDILLARDKKNEEVEKLVTEMIPINYALAKEIIPQLNGKLTDRGKISADERTNLILITDVRRIVDEAKIIARELDTTTPQVLIEARIVQTNPTFTSELGIAWGGSYTNKVGTGNYTLAGAAGDNYAINLPASGIHGGLGLGFLSDRVSLDLKLTAMEKDEKVKIISRPKIVTLDNKKAMIEQGVAIPYLKSSEDGISTEFKTATLSLEVTPHITPDGSVFMKVVAKKDQVSSQTGYAGQPGIDTRRAQTEVLVRDGETTVIGGIYERTQSNAESGVPFLSKIPILGWLFKSKFEKDEITELLIFLTPTVVKQKPLT